MYKVESSEIIQNGCCVVVLKSQSMFADMKNFVIERLCFSVFVLFTIKVCQTIEWVRHVRMLRFQSLFANVERAVIERFGFDVVALFTIEFC